MAYRIFVVGIGAELEQGLDVLDLALLASQAEQAVRGLIVLQLCGRRPSLGAVRHALDRITRHHKPNNTQPYTHSLLVWTDLKVGIETSLEQGLEGGGRGVDDDLGQELRNTREEASRGTNQPRWGNESTLTFMGMADGFCVDEGEIRPGCGTAGKESAGRCPGAAVGAHPIG